MDNSVSNPPATATTATQTEECKLKAMNQILKSDSVETFLDERMDVLKRLKEKAIEIDKATLDDLNKFRKCVRQLKAHAMQIEKKGIGLYKQKLSLIETNHSMIEDVMGIITEYKHQNKEQDESKKPEPLDLLYAENSVHDLDVPTNWEYIEDMNITHNLDDCIKLMDVNCEDTKRRTEKEE